MSVKLTLFVTLLSAMAVAFVGTILWETLLDLFKGGKRQKRNRNEPFNDQRGEKK